VASRVALATRRLAIATLSLVIAGGGSPALAGTDTTLAVELGENTASSRETPAGAGAGGARSLVLEVGSSSRVHDDADPLLDLVLVRPRRAAGERTPIGAGWRHSYDIVLTALGERRVVHDSAGARYLFEPLARESGRNRRARADTVTFFRSSDPRAGTLERRGDVHRWRRDDGTVIDFSGSSPVAMRDATAHRTVSFVYADGRLAEVGDGQGRTLHFSYEDERLRRITLPDASTLHLALASDGTLRARRTLSDVDLSPAECRPSGAESVRAPEPSCDTTSDPIDRDFLDGPGIPGALRLDARPASCRSYFVEHRGTERGERIETALAGLAHYAHYAPTVRSFPIVDFIGAELRVVRSRDLALSTYDNSPDGLYERLLRDGDDIARHLLEPLARDGRLSVTELGRTTTLGPPAARPVVLELVVRRGFASADQVEQIERARAALQERHGVRLRVIEIP